MLAKESGTSARSAFLIKDNAGGPTPETLSLNDYVNQLVCAVGGVLVFVAKSEWRGEQKKWKKWNLTCLIICYMPTIISEHLSTSISIQRKVVFVRLSK